MRFSSGKWILLCTLVLPALAVAEDHAKPSLGPAEALARLKAGNQRFASASMSSGKPTAERRAETAKGQHPFAIIIGCADSRTAPEIEPAVQAVKGKPGDPLANAIHENDALVAEKIRKKARLGDLASEVRVVEGYYDLQTGKVEWAK